MPQAACVCLRVSVHLFARVAAHWAIIASLQPATSEELDRGVLSLAEIDNSTQERGPDPRVNVRRTAALHTHCPHWSFLM